MFATVIRGHCLGGGKDVYPGEVMDLEPKVFQQKEQQGFVRESTPEEAAKFVSAREGARKRARAAEVGADAEGGDVDDSAGAGEDASKGKGKK